MKKYTSVETNQMERLYCNCCGKEIKIRNGIVEEGVLSVEQQWSYFSNKDGEAHSFDLCEECYNEIIKNFKIPVGVEESTELI